MTDVFFKLKKSGVLKGAAGMQPWHRQVVGIVSVFSENQLSQRQKRLVKQRSSRFFFMCMYDIGTQY